MAELTLVTPEMYRDFIEKGVVVFSKKLSGEEQHRAVIEIVQRHGEVQDEDYLIDGSSENFNLRFKVNDGGTTSLYSMPDDDQKVN